MALVPPAILLPGCGSNVSSWLGPPPSHSRMTDCAGPRDFSACWARSCPTGVSQREPGQLEETAAVECRQRKAHGDPQWLQENSVVFSRAQKRSVNRSLRSLARGLGEPRKRNATDSSGVGRRVRTARNAVSTAVRSSAARPAIWPAAREEAVLDLVANDLAVHEQEPLRDRAAAGVELILAAVAVAADEIVAAGVRREPDEPVRLRARAS